MEAALTVAGGKSGERTTEDFIRNYSFLYLCAVLVENILKASAFSEHATYPHAPGEK
jgi:hypothetical protein